MVGSPKGHMKMCTQNPVIVRRTKRISNTELCTPALSLVASKTGENIWTSLIYRLILKYLLVLLFAFPLISSALTFEEIREIKHAVIYHAVMNDVDPALALYVVNGESRFNPLAVGDTHLTCKATGKPIRSRGLFQWNNCANPQVTDAQAFNPDYIIPFSIPKMKDLTVCKKEWTLCAKYISEHKNPNSHLSRRDSGWLP